MSRGKDDQVIELYADPGRGDMLVGAAAVGLDAEEWMRELTPATGAAMGDHR